MMVPPYDFALIIGIVLQTHIAMGIDGETWPTVTLSWTSDTPSFEPLLQSTITEPDQITLGELIDNSNNFPIAFPSNEMRASTLTKLVDREILEDNINGAYPLVHEEALGLFVGFLYQKKRFGSTSERDLYQNLTVVELIDRLLTKRAVTFTGPQDEYLLLNGAKGKGGWEAIGTTDEASPLTLQNSLSYDEIKLSALLSVSSPSYFKGGYEGVVVGAIGPRLEKPKVMEYREIMKTKDQNTHVYGYGEFFVPTMQGVFTNFWGDISITYEEMVSIDAFSEKGRYIKISDDEYFDKWVYSRRIALSIDTILIEANARAQQQNQTASIHVAGLGLTEWKITKEQDTIFVDTFIKRIEFLGAQLGQIENVSISQIENYDIDEKIPIDSHPQGGIRVKTSRTNEADSGNLQIFVYNWNGNALPGNEYWLHNSATSDGAAMAESSEIAELQNPHINSNVRGDNLKVVTIKGLVSLKDYLEAHQSN